MLALLDGVVTEVVQHNDATGIHCSNLGKWNGITLQGTTAAGVRVLVDYVHIQPGSAFFSVGDAVRSGEQLAAAGASPGTPS